MPVEHRRDLALAAKGVVVVAALLAAGVGDRAAGWGMVPAVGAASFVFVAAVQVIAIPAVQLFYGVPLLENAALLALIALLAAIGLVAVGTLFSAMAVNTKLAEMLLPVLSLPFFVPVVIPAAQATARLIAGRPGSEIVGWLKLLVAFDIVFVAACTLAFPFTIEE